MFLSKKNAIYFNKPKTIDPSRTKRILAGWEDDQQQKRETYDYHQKTQSKQPSNNLLVDEQYVDLPVQKSNKHQGKDKFYHTWDELDERTDIECEKRLIEEIVQPGGIRVKPNDNMLAEFMKEVKGMQTYIIGSLLLSKLEANYPFQTKAKALYTIQYLIKKNDNYLSYFKAQVDKIKQFPQPEDNVDNFRKILKTVLNVIGISNTSTASFEEESKTVFVDPGYNDQPKSSLGNFIQSNANKGKKTQTKKTIIGPGQNKLNKQQPKIQNTTASKDFLSLDLLGTETKPATNLNLLNESESIGQQPANYDLMMFGVNQKQDKAQNNFLF